ncbi:hypothetical protein BC828DRAFT_387296 [Blastocladiella britannica]|nr:hypothetical protein BC828DRAFT_387296 [Blastocladiella britannica]
MPTIKPTPTTEKAVAIQVSDMHIAGELIALDIGKQLPSPSTNAATCILIIGHSINDREAVIAKLTKHKLAFQEGFGSVGKNAIVVVGVQQLHKNLHKISINPKQLTTVYILEPTVVVTKTFKKIWVKFERKGAGAHFGVIGYGITLERHDKKPIVPFFDELCYHSGLQEGIEARSLRRLDRSFVTVDKEDAQLDTMLKIVNKLVYCRKRIVVSLNSNAEADRMVAMINLCWTAPVAAKWTVRTECSQKDKAVRDFNMGNISVLIKIFSTKDIGLEQVDALVLSHKTKSHPRFLKIVQSLMLIGHASTPLSVFEVGTGSDKMMYQNISEILASQAKDAKAM